jgi:small subunit ribosomal protein SAe
MSCGLPILDPTEDDIRKLLTCRVHLGTKNLLSDMERYVYARRKDGIHIIDLHMTWQKLILAARVLVAIENPQDICAISARPYGQRAVLKFSHYTGAQCIAGRYTPGAFTNQIQEKYIQPRVLLITDPRIDHMSVLESAYVNIPVIGFCDTDSPIRNIDLVIPCNNRGPKAVGMLYWMLTREILRMRGTIARSVPWEIKVDLFFYRDAEEMRKKEEELLQQQQAQQSQFTVSQPAEYVDKTTFEKTVETGAPGQWGDETANWETPAAQWGAE